MRHRFAAFLLAAALLASVARAEEPEETPAYEVPAAAAKLLASQGFAVSEGNGSRLSGHYMHPRGPIFVTADSALGGYLLLLRRLGRHLHEGWDAEVEPHVRAWPDALASAVAPAGAVRFARVLQRLYRPLPDDVPDATRADVEAALAALRAGRDSGLALPADRARLGGRWVGDRLHPAERWEVVLYLLTRASFAKAGVRKALQETLPEVLREKALAHLAWVGDLEATFPGRTGILDVRIYNGDRFPPGTIDDPALRELDLGATLGLGWAERAGRKHALAPEIRKRYEEVPADSLRGRLQALLCELATPDERAPAMFETDAWQALTLQTACGVDVLFRRAVGVAAGVDKFFGRRTHPGFVHPDPAWWKRMAALCRGTVKDVRAAGIRIRLPSAEDVAALRDAIATHLKEETPFTAEEMHLLEWLGVGGYSWVVASEWGTPAWRAMDKKQRAFARKELQSWLDETERYSPLKPRARAAEEPYDVKLMERLADICDRWAGSAEAQLEGRVDEKFEDNLGTYGDLLDSIDAAFPAADPLCTDAPVFHGVGGRTLFAGLGPVDTLWVLYPTSGEPVLGRGAVLSYRRAVAEGWIDEEGWRERLGSDEAPVRPAWAKAFFAE